MCNINLEIDFPGAKIIKTEKDGVNGMDPPL